MFENLVLYSLHVFVSLGGMILLREARYCEKALKSNWFISSSLSALWLGSRYEISASTPPAMLGMCYPTIMDLFVSELIVHTQKHNHKKKSLS